MESSFDAFPPSASLTSRRSTEICVRISSSLDAVTTYVLQIFKYPRTHFHKSLALKILHSHRKRFPFPKMSSDADVPDSQDSQYHIHGRITETRHTRKRMGATPSPEMSKRVKQDRRNTPSPLSSFFRPSSRSKYHPSRLFTKALEKLGRKSPEPKASSPIHPPSPLLAPSPLVPPARPARAPVKIIQRGSERLRDEGIVASIQGMVGALLKCEDTHAWLASEKGVADLFISKE